MKARHRAEATRDEGHGRRSSGPARPLTVAEAAATAAQTASSTAAVAAEESAERGGRRRAREIVEADQP